MKTFITIVATAGGFDAAVVEGGVIVERATGLTKYDAASNVMERYADRLVVIDHTEMNDGAFTHTRIKGLDDG